jgi:hypothetical protein
LRLKGYPQGYQVLCMNCQVGRRDNGGVCPHQSRRMDGEELLLEFDKLRVGQRNLHNGACQRDAKGQGDYTLGISKRTEANEADPRGPGPTPRQH